MKLLLLLDDTFGQLKTYRRLRRGIWSEIPWVTDPTKTRWVRRRDPKALKVEEY